ARGLHPPILAERGLGPAVGALARRAPLPVEVAHAPDERFAPAVEVAAYYVVAEALTNVAKHAHATRATVSVRREDALARGRGRRRRARRREPARRKRPRRPDRPRRGAARDARGHERRGLRDDAPRRVPTR